MKKILILIALISCFAYQNVSADNVIINGETLWTIFFSPFDSYPDIVKLRGELKDYATNCTEDNCTFLSTWKIVDNRLTLTKIENCECNMKKQIANLKSLFGDKVKNGMMVADWFSGEIWVTNSQPNSWAGMFAASWPSETRLIVKDGIVSSVKSFVYPKPTETLYSKDPSALSTFVQTHLNWKKFHDLPERNTPYYFSFTPDSNGYIRNIRYWDNGSKVLKPDDSEMEEIGRVLGLIKMPVYYRHAQVVQGFVPITVVLGKELQDRYLKGK